MTTSIVTLLVEHDGSHGDPETWDWKNWPHWKDRPDIEMTALGSVTAAPRRATESYADIDEVRADAPPGAILVAANGEWMIYLDANDKVTPFAAPDDYTSPDETSYKWISFREVSWPLRLEWSPDDRFG